jgi:hypothetical protein
MTQSAQTTLCDQVPYRALVFPEAHPDRLATIATLFGMQPANVERCRVLEIGCAGVVGGECVAGGVKHVRQRLSRNLTAPFFCTCPTMPPTAMVAGK